MRQITIVLFAFLALLSFAFAKEAPAPTKPLFPDGKYKLFTGNQHNPKDNRYFTAHIDARAGSVRLEKVRKPPTSTDKGISQVWKLHNVGKGQVTLESLAKKGRYLSQGRSGANPGAYLGVTSTKQKWNINRVYGGAFTKYVLSYPRLHNNKTLVIAQTPDNVNPKRLALLYQEDEGLNAWKFQKA